MGANACTQRYSLGEEIANSITHGVGIILSLAGLAVLIAYAWRYGNVWHIVSCSVFGATLILLSRLPPSTTASSSRG